MFGRFRKKKEDAKKESVEKENSPAQEKSADGSAFSSRKNSAAPVTPKKQQNVVLNPQSAINQQDRQLAEISKGYKQLVSLMESIKKHLESQAKSQQQLIKSLENLPEIAEGLKKMSEASEKQATLMRDQIDATSLHSEVLLGGMSRFHRAMIVMNALVLILLMMVISFGVYFALKNKPQMMIQQQPIQQPVKVYEKPKTKSVTLVDAVDNSASEKPVEKKSDDLLTVLDNVTNSSEESEMLLDDEQSGASEDLATNYDFFASEKNSSADNEEFEMLLDESSNEEDVVEQSLDATVVEETTNIDDDVDALLDGDMLDDVSDDVNAVEESSDEAVVDETSDFDKEIDDILDDVPNDASAVEESSDEAVLEETSDFDKEIDDILDDVDAALSDEKSPAIVEETNTVLGDVSGEDAVFAEEIVGTPSAEESVVEEVVADSSVSDSRDDSAYNAVVSSSYEEELSWDEIVDKELARISEFIEDDDE